MPCLVSLLRSTVKLLALAAMPLIVASCAADLNPSPAPTGYKYAGQQYDAAYTGPVKPMNYPGMATPGMAMPVSGPQPGAADLATPMAPVPDAGTHAGPMPLYNNPGDQSAVTPRNIAPGAGDAGANSVWRQAAADLLTRTERDFGRMRDPVYIRPPATSRETAFVQALTDTMRQRQYKISADLQKSAFVADYSIGGASTGQTDVTLKINGQDGRPLRRESGDYALNDAPAPMETAPPVEAPQTPVAPVAAAAPQSTFWTGRSDAQAAAATPGGVSASGGKTYIYDGRDTKPAGHTAYEQLQGVEHVVGGNDLADR